MFLRIIFVYGLLLVSRVSAQSWIPTSYRFLNETELTATSGSFDYPLRFFKDVQQYEYGRWIATIGTFQSFQDGLFLLNDGTYCGAIGAPRSGRVQLFCDSETWFEASEPSTCVYHFKVYHPMLCESNAIYNGKLRLISNQTAGRLEIYYNGQWGTICDDYWNNRSATVACRQLGYEVGTAYSNAYFGPGIDPIWLDDIQCVGNETYLMDCIHLPWGNHNCVHGEDAGVICGMNPPPSPPPPNPPPPSPPPPSPPPPSPPPPSPPPPSPPPPSPPPPSPPPPSPPPPSPPPPSPPPPSPPPPSPPPPSPPPPSSPPPSSPPPSPPPPSPPPPSPPPPSSPPPSSPPPSPPPPSPPPPLPPPPSPPPPPPTVLSKETITLVQNTVSTAIATSVASSVSSSVGAATAGSTSMPSANPAGIVSMVSVLQTMENKQNLQMGGELPASFQGLTGSVSWINLDLPITDTPNGRRLLSLDTRPEIKKSIHLCILFGGFIGIFVPLHYGFHQWKPIPGLLGFPQLEFTLLMVFVNPITKCAGALFSTGDISAIFFGIGMLWMLPLPWIGYTIYVIRKYITHTRAAKFIMFHPIQTYDHWKLIQRGFLSGNSGHWRCKGNLLETYGLFFQSIRGPIHVLKDPSHIVHWDPQQKKYKYGKWILVNEMFQWIRTYYKPYLLAKNSLVILCLQCFQYSPNGNAIQIIFLILFYVVHLSVLMILAPFNHPKDQLTEVLTSLCELGTYLCGILILMVKRGNLFIDLKLLEQGLFALQTGSIAVQIVSQMAILLVMVGLVHQWFLRTFMESYFVQKNRTQYLLKKYANRWLWKVQGRCLGQPRAESLNSIKSLRYLIR